MGSARGWLAVKVAGSVVLALAGPAVASDGARTERISVASDGTQGDEDSFSSAISADGRYVAFASDATNLVPGDTNGFRDVFVRDRQTGTTSRVNVASDGSQANHFTPGDGIAISADGRYVTFISFASNLVSGDTNGNYDAFVHDRLTGTTSLVSVSSTGVQGDVLGFGDMAISADGRYVAFVSGSRNLVHGKTSPTADVFVRDRWAGTTTRVSLAGDGSEANGGSFNPAISADGRYVAFNSFATNLVPGDVNNEYDVFVRDRFAGTTSMVSVSSAGVQGDTRSFTGLALSADGRYVTFNSNASNLVPGDTNEIKDTFVRDRQTGVTSRVSVATDGTQASGGTVFPFGAPFKVSISWDGRYVAFSTESSNLVPRDTNGFRDVFVRDRWAGTTRRVSVSTEGAQGDADSSSPSLSADGSDVSFESLASNLVPGDTNGRFDVFVQHRASSIDSIENHRSNGG
jgi:Periplasmic component of the Tol biopolymer transport system